MESYLRLARIEELDQIYTILEEGRRFLKDQGLPQWQGGYGPTKHGTQEELEEGQGYAFIYQGRLSGYLALQTDTQDLLEGAWEVFPQKKLAVIKHVAMADSTRGKGLGKKMLEDSLRAAFVLGYEDVRIDTHKDNVVMQKLIASLGFARRGVLDLGFPNGMREAYQFIVG